MTETARDNNVVLHKKRLPLKKLIAANKSITRLEAIKINRDKILKDENVIIGLDENGIPITKSKGKKDDVKAASDQKKTYRNGELIDEAPVKENNEEVTMSEEGKKLQELEENNKKQIEKDSLVNTK
jgi:hypothetical protein